MNWLQKKRAAFRQFDALKKLQMELSGGVVHLTPSGIVRGHALLSYITLPFVTKDPHYLDGHTNRWESRDMAAALLERGYAVDIIDWDNQTFKPKRHYDIFIDIGPTMERIAPLLGDHCLKVFHATGAHWLFQNHAEYTRLLQLKERRGFILSPQRIVPPSRSVESADIVTILGNSFTHGTYEYAKKQLLPIPLSTTHTYDFPTRAKGSECRFIWFGGSGLVHKGLDITLEAFAAMPEYELTVCGPISSEPEFRSVYHKELFESPNITVLDRIDPGGPEFKKLMQTHSALIHPSCSEGQSGAVVTCMHAGFVPILSRESGVDVDNFGTVLLTNNVDTIRAAVQEHAARTSDDLLSRSRAAWEYARTHHTRETFSKSFRAILDTLL